MFPLSSMYPPHFQNLSQAILLHQKRRLSFPGKVWFPIADPHTPARCSQCTDHLSPPRRHGCVQLHIFSYCKFYNPVKLIHSISPILISGCIPFGTVKRKTETIVRLSLYSVWNSFRNHFNFSQIPSDTNCSLSLALWTWSSSLQHARSWKNYTHLHSQMKMDEPYKIFLKIPDYETASPDSGKYPVIPGETPSSKVYFCMENRSPAIHRCYNMHGYARSRHPDTSLNLKNPVLLSNARTHQGNCRSPSAQTTYFLFYPYKNPSFSMRHGRFSACCRLKQGNTPCLSLPESLPVPYGLPEPQAHFLPHLPESGLSRMETGSIGDTAPPS